MKITPIKDLPANHTRPPGVDPSDFAIPRRLEVPFWIFDIDYSRIVFANKSACELWGAKDEATLRARDMGKDMSSTVTKRLRQYQSDFQASDPSFTELWTLYPNGEPKSVMVVFRGYQLPDGRMAMQCEAIGDTGDIPQNLRSAEALLHTDVMITLFAADGAPLYQNPAARNALVAADTSFADLFVHQSDYDAAITQIDILGEHRLVTRVYTVAGDRWYDISAKKCSDAVTGQPAILVTAIDVSELKEARDTARYLADRDQLTNLHNRAYLQNYLAELPRRPTEKDCAVIFFDLDRFKLINDRFGHAMGDEVLRQVAVRAVNTLRGSDIVARLGGDEFVILLEGIDAESQLMDRVAELRAAISRPIVKGEHRVDVTISIGVASFSPGTTGFTEVLREADVALYASKQAGRNRATFFTREMGEAAKARDKMELELKRAVQEGEFVLHYQPRLDIRTGHVVAVEGLVRWNHPERGVVGPDEFIPICEETGLIEDLGRMVLEQGCAQAIAWDQAGLDINVSLNVSPRQFGDDHFMQHLIDLTNLPGFPKGKIELEITENVLIGDHQMIAEKLKAITEIGYRIAIDDFGTGYSNLSYISRFPLTCLKIDRTFIDQLPASGPIIRLILTLGQQIGATVVSEGVETQEQMDWLAERDCDQAQGYLIARPLAVEDLMSFLYLPNDKSVAQAQ